MVLTFRKLHPHFVAEVSPVDLRQVYDHEILAQIRAGMDEYAILVFRDQPFADDEQLAFAQRQGYRTLGVHRPMTPYGLGPQVESYEAPGGARVLRIPSYGMVAGEDWSLRAAEWKVFWILWKAGVQVVLVGGTSGTCDWRDGEDAVHPGDLVLPWTYLSLDAVPSGLPGTELENVLAERVALMDEPFCPALASTE